MWIFPNIKRRWKRILKKEKLWNNENENWIEYFIDLYKYFNLIQLDAEQNYRL